MKTGFLYKIISNNLKIIINILLLIFFCHSVIAQEHEQELLYDYTLGNYFPENWETRLKHKEMIFAEITRLSSKWKGKYRQKECQGVVHYHVNEKDDNFFILFHNENKAGIVYEYRRGNISIKRNKNNGSFIYMTVLIRDNPECFVRIFPFGKRSLLNLYLFGVKIYEEIVLPVSFEGILTVPFSRIISLTSEIIDWNVVLYEENGGKYIIHIVNTIRKYLPYLKDEEDGAINSDGVPILIDSGNRSNGGMNCAGFTKWIIDGFYFPIVGRYMNIENLKIKHINYRGNKWSSRYEKEKDPYFGLDWSRNLACLLAGARNNERISNPEQFDVRDIEYFSYIEDVGYRVSDLKLISYLLAVKNPGYFYIGSINKDYLRKPCLRQHTHLVIIFPVFNRNGNFKAIVMERNKETSLYSFIKRYKDSYIHLVSVSARGSFSVLPFENKLK